MARQHNKRTLECVLCGMDYPSLEVLLRYLTDCGLALGTEGAVDGNPNGAGLIQIRVESRELLM